MSIAIDIGTRTIHLVQGKVNKQSISIKQAINEPIPSGLMQDGIIREFGGLEMALRNMLTKYHVGDKACQLTTNGNHIYGLSLIHI